ncbi:type II toxin-antitoxin system VapC family toxin [Candidatus Gottesmanbacteria bacterium]|nr:type II toxin-antitoxin system VapC family toxin [Candidatus Gottesmanbacteria bacterium]
MKILVDADVLVALAKEDDNNHPKAVKIAKSLEKETLFITPLAIPEAATVLSYRISQKIAGQFLNEARQRKLVELSLTPQTCLLTDEIFLKQKQRGISWIDCLNIAMVQVYHLDGIFSFDKFYSKFSLKHFGR